MLLPGVVRLPDILSALPAASRELSSCLAGWPLEQGASHEVRGEPAFPSAREPHQRMSEVCECRELRVHSAGELATRRSPRNRLAGEETKEQRQQQQRAWWSAHKLWLPCVAGPHAPLHAWPRLAQRLHVLRHLWGLKQDKGGATTRRFRAHRSHFPTAGSKAPRAQMPGPGLFPVRDGEEGEFVCASSCRATGGHDDDIVLAGPAPSQLASVGGVPAGRAPPLLLGAPPGVAAIALVAGGLGEDLGA